jgi:hypothetical protein
MMRGRSSDCINGKHYYLDDINVCQAQCDAAPACTGYSYDFRSSGSSALCEVYGPGLDRDLAGGWDADTYPATTIGGADTSYSAYVCVAVAGRN